jgi:hypothetical protein
VAKENRSLMNIPFTLKDAALDEEFLKGAKARGLVQLKGHRSVGGMRASIYNAMPVEGVQALVDYMKDFEKRTADSAPPSRPAPGRRPVFIPERDPEWPSPRKSTLNAISKRACPACPRTTRSATTVADPDAILVRSQVMHEMPIPASVLAIGRAGAGTNNIPVKAMSERGVVVFNAPGANANAVKELVIAGMLMGARNMLPALNFVAGLQGDDESLHKQVEAGKKHFVGHELPGRTLGIIGLGAIGSLVADAAIQLGMHVIGFDPEITVDAAWRLPSQVKKAASRTIWSSMPISSACTYRWCPPPRI